MANNIYLIGMMGSGKTVVSKVLAKKLKRKRADIDQMITDDQGMSIPAIFDKVGEASFRQIEKAQLAKVAEEDGLVVSTGGGTVVDDTNLEMMKQTGMIIYLKASTDVLYSHIKNTASRPLLRDDNPREKLEQIFESRKHQYERADYTLMVDGKAPDEVAENIVELLELERKI